MQIDLKRFQETFFEEAEEHLETIESGLLSLVDRGADAELLNTIFRAPHSIKGAAGSFGFNELAHLTHVMENVLDRLRAGQRVSDASLTQRLLRASDRLRELVAATRKGTAASVPTDDVVAELESEMAGAPAPATAPAAIVPVVAAPGETAYRVVFEPERDFFRQGQDLFLLLRDLAEVGEVLAVECRRDALPPLEEMDPEECYLGWTIRLRTARPENELHDVFMFVEGSCRLEITADSTEPSAAAPLAAAGAGPAAAHEERRAGGQRRTESSSIRVPTEKVDGLINLVGELVISQAMVNQALNSLGSKLGL